MSNGGDSFHHDLKPPTTRAPQAWTAFWQRYVGEGPAKLLKLNRTTLPAIRARNRRLGRRL